MEKRALQGVLLVLSLVPLVGIAIGFGSGAGFFFPKGAEVPINLDNQFRYLSGVYTMVTLGIWWCLRDLESRGAVLRIIGGGIIIGAVGRVISMVALGLPPDKSMIAGVFLEGVVVPLLLLWQVRISRMAHPKHAD